MARSKQTVSQDTLRRMWEERCKQGNFSAGVLGVGTVRVFGKSGDAPLTFPRIESLTALDALTEDERWALTVAQDVVTAAQARQRPVMATQPPTAGMAPTPTPVREFDPKQENILILSLTRGG
jgi:hypothetical protein